jgi:hypothetical protein
MSSIAFEESSRIAAAVAGLSAVGPSHHPDHECLASKAHFAPGHYPRDLRYLFLYILALPALYYH